MKSTFSITCTATLLALATTGALAETVKLAGSLTVVHALVNPNREKVEKASGHTLQIVSNATGKGLIDLVDNNADIAMISGPLDTALATAEIAGKKIDGSRLKVHELRGDEIAFLVHAANPVSKLTLAQIGDIHTGKIANWKLVGGKDQPITVYTTTPAGATSAVVKKSAMGGSDYVASAKTMVSFTRITDLVPGDESAIGALGRSFVKSDGKTKVIETTRLMRPLALVTLGEPSAKAKLVIDAFKAVSLAGKIEIAAICTTQVKPDMPRKALQEGVEGVVQAQALIRDGAVKEVTIVSGPRIFHSAVRDAMLQYKCANQPGELMAPQEFVFKAGRE